MTHAPLLAQVFHRNVIGGKSDQPVDHAVWLSRTPDAREWLAFKSHAVELGLAGVPLWYEEGGGDHFLIFRGGVVEIGAMLRTLTLTGANTAIQEVRVPSTHQILEHRDIRGLWAPTLH